MFASNNGQEASKVSTTARAYDVLARADNLVRMLEQQQASTSKNCSLIQSVQQKQVQLEKSQQMVRQRIQKSDETVKQLKKETEELLKKQQKEQLTTNAIEQHLKRGHVSVQPANHSDDCSEETKKLLDDHKTLTEERDQAKSADNITTKTIEDQIQSKRRKLTLFEADETEARNLLIKPIPQSIVASSTPIAQITR